jgi:hypothetical protein
MRTRRLILRVLVSALAGAVLTVAVAWVCDALARRGGNVRVTRLGDGTISISIKSENPFGARYFERLPRKGGSRTSLLPWSTLDLKAGWPCAAAVVTRPQFPVWTTGGQTRVMVLWPGFALDTVFYGAIVFLLWSAPGFVRQRRRTRRGACVRCGYDLAGTAGPCPECGSTPP